MPLKAVVDEAAVQALEEPLRPFYRKVEDEKDPMHGRFVLDVEGADGYALEPVDSLRKALATERDQATKLLKKLKGYDGIDPTDVKDRLARLEKLEALDPEKDAERLASEKVKAAEGRLKADFAKREQEFAAELQKLKSARSRDILQGEAKAAILAAKGEPDLLLDQVLKRARVEEDEAGNFKIKVIDDAGVVRLKSATEEMGLSDLISEFRKHATFSRAFAPEPTPQGGGTPPGAGSGGAPPPATKARTAMTLAERDAYISNHGHDAYAKLPL